MVRNWSSKVISEVIFSVPRLNLAVLLAGQRTGVCSQRETLMDQERGQLTRQWVRRIAARGESLLGFGFVLIENVAGQADVSNVEGESLLNR